MKPDPGGECSSEYAPKGEGFVEQRYGCPCQCRLSVLFRWLKHALGTKMVGMGNAMRLMSQVPLLAPWW
jgi:hypothetical protein